MSNNSTLKHPLSFCPHKQDELYVWDISYIFTHKLLGFANSQQVRYAKSTIKVVTEMLLHLLQWNAYLAQEVSNKVNRVFHMIQSLIVSCKISLNLIYNLVGRKSINRIAKAISIFRKLVIPNNITFLEKQ